LASTIPVSASMVLMLIKARHSFAIQSLETFTEFGSGVYFYDPDGNKVQVFAPDYQA
jgi:hypothetical protein